MIFPLKLIQSVLSKQYQLIVFRYKPRPAIAHVPRRARLPARPRGRQQVRVSLLEARVREPGAIIQVTLILELINDLFLILLLITPSSMHSLTSPSVMRRRASPGGGGAQQQQRRGQVRNHPLLDPLQACYLCTMVV